MNFYRDIYILFLSKIYLIMKIYINIKNGKFRPMFGQSEFLDKNWDEELNHNNLTEKSKSLIAGLRNDMYVSENFSFDPKTLIFNFEEIHTFDEEDFDSFNEYKFDCTIKYESTPVETTDQETKTDKTEQESEIIVKPVQNIDTTNNILSVIKKNYKCPSINSGFYVQQKTWNYLVRNIIKKKNTLLLGPTGTGKTDIPSGNIREVRIEKDV